MKKVRVWTLYRVSTKTQLTNTQEIPTQRHQCKLYIERLAQENWELCREVSENGVSAFKNKAIDREILQQIKTAAQNKEFDILLVYKADRLGRLGTDSMLYLLDLYEYGVKVFSTVENYLNVGTVQNRMMTSMYFHMSEGESASTSQRVTDFMKMYNEEGKYMGGTAPYGYKIIDTGEMHWKKRDKTIKKLEIIEDESEVVKLIYSLSYDKGMGSTRIARYLNEETNYKSRVGGIWRDNVVGRILRNTIYIGLKQFNVTSKKKIQNPRNEYKFQPKDENLVIIDENIFWKVQQNMDNRLPRDFMSTHDRPNPTSSKLLLAGIVKCGYCGARLKTDYTIKYYKRKSDGETTKMKVTRYVCCNGKTDKLSHEVSQFGSKKYEAEFEELLFEFLKKVDIDSFQIESDKYQREITEKSMREVNSLRSDLQKKYKEINALKDEVVKVITGESTFDRVMLQDIISKKEFETTQLNKLLSEAEVRCVESKIEADDIKTFKDEFSNLEEKYRAADINEKKVMLARIIKDLQFKKDEIKMKIALPIEKSINLAEFYGSSSTPVPTGMGMEKYPHNTKVVNIAELRNLASYQGKIAELEFELDHRFTS